MKSEIKIQVIEPPIYSELNWEMNKIMPALEFLRLILPEYLIEIPKTAEYYLILYGDKSGNPFPAIGVGSNDSKIMSQIPDFHILYERVEEIINNHITVDRIKQEIKNHKTISWNELKEMKYFPRE